MRGPELERYEILGELGQGGMSVVYRARDRQLSRVVAVKVLHEFLARQTDARKRFHREAVAVAKLHHPGILEIFDYSGPDAKDTYIVTELIDGVTLREMFDKRGKPPYPEVAVLIVAELIRALKHAHEQSVIHRDLKPENVMITKGGQLKLMDFGLAQLMDGGTKLTATGTLLGSPAHMAPEVIDGKTSDARADLFSMGTILFWLATGKLPFEAQNPSALFKKILDGKYDDPQMLEPKIGNALARIIQRALDPDPEQRYQDVTEIEHDLQTELALVELLPCDIHAKSYFTEPERFIGELGPKLITLLTTSGKQALAEGNIARAMDRFNRVLAIDPHLDEVLKIVSRVGRKKELARRARQVATFTLIGALAGGASYGAVKLLPQIRDGVAPKVAETEIAKAPPAAAEHREPMIRAENATVATSRPTPHPEEHEPAAKKKDREPLPALQPLQTTPLPKRRTQEPRIASATTQLPANSGTDRAGSEHPAAEQSENSGGPNADAAAAQPKAVFAKIVVRIGPAFAAALDIDGVTRENGIYRGSYDLAVGRHVVRARGANGEAIEKVIEVTDTGEAFAIDAAGRFPLRAGELSIVLQP